MRAAGISGVAGAQAPADHRPAARAARPTRPGGAGLPPDGPNLTWSADITYISTWEGFLYLAHVQDLFSRLIVGWSMADHLRAELVVSALEMALYRRRPDRGLIHHSDMGCQYTAVLFTKRCDKAGDRDLDGLRRRLLRQRRLRDVPREPQEGADLPTLMADPRRGQSSRVRVHRGLVQPPPPALHPRLPLPSRVRTPPRRARARRTIYPRISLDLADLAYTASSQRSASPSPATAQSLPRSPSSFQPISLRPRRTAVKGRTELPASPLGSRGASSLIQTSTTKARRVVQTGGGPLAALTRRYQRRAVGSSCTQAGLPRTR